MKPTLNIPWSDFLKYALYQMEQTKSFPKLKPETIQFMKTWQSESDHQICETPDYIEVEIETDTPYIKP